MRKQKLYHTSQAVGIRFTGPTEHLLPTWFHPIMPQKCSIAFHSVPLPIILHNEATLPLWSNPLWNAVEHYGTLWSIRNLVEHYGTVWDPES